MHIGEAGAEQRVDDVDLPDLLHLPEQHQRFYEQLPFMLAGSVDPAGRPWATLLVGPPGFVRATDERLATCALRPQHIYGPEDPHAIVTSFS